MPNPSLPHLRSLVQARRRLFAALLLGATALALGRYLFPWPSDWLAFALYTIVFIVGVVIAPFIFLTEDRWIPFLESKFQLRFTNQSSPLRNGLLFIVLPILGVFLLSSSRSPLGLGFLWGISTWYAGEAWQVLRGNTALRKAYFPQKMSQDEPQYILWGFCLYAALLTLGILFIS